MNEDLKALVVGGGSAGVRHFRYLTEYGVKCSVCDPLESCRVTQEFPDAEHFPDFDAVDLSGFDAVMIATPPFLHVPQAIAAAHAGCHILLEKPISISEEGLDELEQIVEETRNIKESGQAEGTEAFEEVSDLISSGLITSLASSRSVASISPDAAMNSSSSGSLGLTVLTSYSVCSSDRAALSMSWS